MRLTLLLAPVLLVALAGCGATTGGDRPNEPARLLLDSTPNAVHAGIYLAASRGFDEAEGVRLQILRPSASTSAPALLEGGRADLAILDIHDLAQARERGHDLVGVMALVQRPLGAVLAQPGVRSPKDLEGERAAVGRLPAGAAVLRSVVAGAGGNPRRLHSTTLGSAAGNALLTHRVAAIAAPWNTDGVALRARRPGLREFRVDDYGAPSYPELVVAVTRPELEDHPSLVRATIRALQRGYSQTQDDPDSAVSTMLEREPALGRAALAAQLDAVNPAFTAGAAELGQLRPAVLRAWAAWEARFGGLKSPVDVARAFDTTLVKRPPTP
jgi:putative hydroxymethylpyrimidine transport system substrate-binding protein